MNGKGRLLLAVEARSLGYGGVTEVSRASGVSRPAIYRGLRELLEEFAEVLMVRSPGGGRKRIKFVDPTSITTVLIW